MLTADVSTVWCFPPDNFVFDQAPATSIRGTSSTTVMQALKMLWVGQVRELVDVVNQSVNVRICRQRNCGRQLQNGRRKLICLLPMRTEMPSDRLVQLVPGDRRGR
jgi:hypothetical protein